MIRAIDVCAGAGGWAVEVRTAHAILAALCDEVIDLERQRIRAAEQCQ
ncbi:hypothetical protein LCGC14_0811460 [marine sediment metagenome]|uniref:Uncharacterized protein n=1 Tax=marine sediment metagenome TaxID=412755 RepID=A0A0F9PLN1_9ZZZZ